MLQSCFTALVAAAASSRGAQQSGASKGAPITLRKVPRTDLTISRLAFGCAMLGWDWDRRDFAERAVPIIRTAYERGITFFDLADVYGNGSSELAMGEVLKESPGLRREVVIQSKCGHRFKDGLTIDNSQDHILASVEGSLRRLGTDYLDIVLLHWPDSLVEPEEVAQAFDILKRTGKVRYFGVSNHSPLQIQLLQKCVQEPLIANQIQLGLMHWYLVPRGLKASWLHAEQGAAALDYCRVHDIWVQAYSPLRASDVGPQPNVFNPPAEAPQELLKLAGMLTNLSRKHGAVPAAVMLAWLLRHPAGITPIIGTTNKDHLLENCLADQVALNREEWYGLLAAAADVRFPGVFDV